MTLELVNNGVLEHEIMFGRDVLVEENRPSGFQEDLFEQAGVVPTGMVEHSDESMAESGGHAHTQPGYMLILPKTGDRDLLSFTVTKDMVGEWEIGCFSQEGVHYTAGMKGKLIVKP